MLSSSRVSQHHKKAISSPPQEPHQNLSAPTSDQLAHASLQPGELKPMQPCKYNTTFTSMTQQVSFGGVNSMNTTTDKHFTRPSDMLGEHEVPSIAARTDINEVVSKNALEGRMVQDLAHNH